MAAVNSAVPSAVDSAVEPVSVGLNQQIGSLSGTDSSYGFAETMGSAANVPGGQVMPPVPADPLTSQLDFIGETQGMHSEPMNTGHGPSVPYEASVTQAQVAHAENNSAFVNTAQPTNKNRYWVSQVKTPAQAPVKAYLPDGTTQYVTPGVATYGQVINWGDHTPINTGLGYYIRESERPFYNTLAAVAPVQQVGTTGYQMPYGGVETQGYNDSGIPSAYQGTPDPYVSPDAVGAEAPAMGLGI